MSLTYSNATSNTGTALITAPAAPGVVWNLSSLIVSFAGPSKGPNARVTVYDGAVGGTVIYRAFLDQPTGSVGMVTDVPLPVDGRGVKCLQALPGNAMNIVVDGFGSNLCSVNARLGDGLPQ